jgi:predicted O-methyltransferase YrrM
MKDTTKKLIEKDPSLQLHKEAEFSSDTKGYSAFNDAGIEVETGEYLYALTRLLKPQAVLETGTHEGIGAAYMGQALKDNGFGKLTTAEFLEPHFKTATQRMKQLELTDYVEVLHTDVAKLYPEAGATVEPIYDLILLDTEPQTRFMELIEFERLLKPGGFVFIHDLNRHMHQIPNEEHGFAWPFGPIPPLMQMLVEHDKLRPFHFSTPRGLTGFYKVSPDDYKWGR